MTRNWLLRLAACVILVAPFSGPLVSASRAEEVGALRDAARAGDADAALRLGLKYDTGDGVPQDQAAALGWYRQAATGGSVSAMFNVGVMYDSGIGTARDRHEAARWYEQAARHGHARAMYALGLLYERGDGVAADPGRALDWYGKAAKTGIDAAKLKVAQLDKSLADKARAASDPDWDRAQDLITRVGLSEAADDAMPLLRRAASRGFAPALYDLGYMTEAGLGTPVDRVRAYVLYERAATASGTAAAQSTPWAAATARAASSGAKRLAASLDPSERAAAREALRTAQR